MKTSQLTVSLQQSGHYVPFSFGPSNVPIYVLIGKALASVAPSPLSWPFSGQDHWARAILVVRCQLARKELTPRLGWPCKIGERKQVYCSAT